MPRSVTADAVVAVAPAVMRQAASSVSAAWKPPTFNHINSAATAAAVAPIHASSRTLAQPGEETRSAKNSRATITT